MKALETKKSQMSIVKSQWSQGYVTLLSIIVVSSVGLAVVLSNSLLSISSIRSSGDFYKSNQAKALANSCAEAALEEIRNSTAFSGSGNLSIGDGSCDYIVSNLGGEEREIISQGSISDIARKVKINIGAINPKINITSWQEVADF